jgi:hypothetical protein
MLTLEPLLHIYCKYLTIVIINIIYSFFTFDLDEFIIRIKI